MPGRIPRKKVQKIKKTKNQKEIDVTKIKKDVSKKQKINFKNETRKIKIKR